METTNIKSFEKVNSNLYYLENIKTYFKLFAKGVTPNGCWLIGAKMVELKDIDVATGKNVYGELEIEFETGEVWYSAYPLYITY